MRCDWDLRSIYSLPKNDVLEYEAFFAAFGKYRDINGHNLETIKTRPKYALMRQAVEHEGLNLADTVLLLHTSDIQGITPGESLRVDGELYRILTVSYPIHGVVRLDLQGVMS